MKNRHHKKKHSHSKDHSKKPASKGPNQQLEGTIFITTKALGFVKTIELEDDIMIEEEDLNTALHGDTVRVALEKRRDSRLKGKIVEIVERKKEEFVGTIEMKQNFILFKPDDKKVYREIIINKNRKSEDLHTDLKVIVKLNEWRDPKDNPHGEIVKILGNKGDHNVEMESIIYERGFSPHHSKAIEDEAKKIKDQAPADFETEVAKRIATPDGPPSTWDFRNTLTFTIDPFDAKDFDDALSFKKLEDGTYEIGIHIADVAHYVTEGSAIDKEAIKRGTSIYLVDRTIPMLPEILSNDLCSLNPNEDKLAFSAIFVINKNGDVQKRFFGETVINSNKRFTYRTAQDVLDKGEGEYFEELNTLNSLALKKRRFRTKNGAISFGGVEVKFELDKDGFPINIYEKELLPTNELIEDFMLLANKEVSEYIDRLNKKSNTINPFIYRIHDKPKQDNITELVTYLKNIGYDLHLTNGNVISTDINELLEKIEGTDEEDLIEKAILKSMSKAIYSTNNIGHFGLAFAHYTHFTSPIRRYPDMIVHRLMRKYLAGGRITKEEARRLQKLADSSSRQEILAVDAERDSVKLKYVEYMSRRIGEEFKGIITSVVDWGVYVREDKTKAEGLVSLRVLKDDYYKVEPQNYRIVGEKTGKAYTLGDKVKIKLIGTDIEKKTIDFEIFRSRDQIEN